MGGETERRHDRRRQELQVHSGLPSDVVLCYYPRAAAQNLSKILMNVPTGEMKDNLGPCLVRSLCVSRFN